MSGYDVQISHRIVKRMKEIVAVAQLPSEFTARLAHPTTAPSAANGSTIESPKGTLAANGTSARDAPYQITR
jgi:hypothetical protein